MAPKDRKVVNFSEDYELNNRLRQNGKRQTEENREALRKIGDKAKEQLDKRVLTHDNLDEAIQKNKNKLE